MAKLKNRIFQIIGQLGITIAMIFGCILCINTGDSAKFIALVVFYLVSSCVFYLVHREKEFSGNRVHYIFNVVNTISLYVGCTVLMGNGFHPVTLLVLMIPVVYLVLMLCCGFKKAGLDFGILFSTYAILTYSGLALILHEESLMLALSGYGVAAVLLCALEWKIKEVFCGKQVAQGVLIWIMVYALSQSENIYIHGLAVLVILPLLIAGYVRKNKVFRYGSMIVLAIGYVFFADVGVIEGFVMGGLALAAAFYLMYRCKEQYSRNFKWLVHGLTVLFLWFRMPEVILTITKDSDIRRIVTYVTWAIFNLAMVKSVFGRNLQTGEKEKNTFYHIINLIAMLVGTIYIGVYPGELLHLVVILTTLATFMVNAKNLLDKRESMLAGIYVGVKFTVLMITVLGSFHTVNYVVSIACLLLAIISIGIGFKAEYRSLRLFGLALSILSIFKLIMLDISYTNTIGNAFSFFVSGLLCFAISMIYNYIAKK